MATITAVKVTVPASTGLRRGVAVGEPVQEGADMLAQLGRHWGWILSFGIITLLAGIVVLAWPAETLLVIAVLFGIQLIIAGIFRFVAAFATEDATGGTRVLLALLGVLSVIIGLWAVRHALLTLLALVVLLGIFWVVNGTIELFTALSNRGMPERGWTAAMGGLSILAGIIVLIYPAPSILTLSIVLGIWLLVYGVMEIVAAFRFRRLADSASPHIAHAH
jgi:uncharacterized membrane protein HdeD (DUF308 family)